MKFTEEKAKILAELWPKYTRVEICKRMGICDNTLHHWVHKLDLPPKKKGRGKLEIKFNED